MTRWTLVGMMALAGGLALSWQGCARSRGAANTVLARVGRETVTLKDLTAIAELSTPDAAKVQQFLSGDADKVRRQQAVESVARSRAMVQFGKLKGVEKDAGYRLILEQLQAQAVFQWLVEKRLPKGDPSEAELKALYDGLAAQQKAPGQGFPPFEMLKEQLSARLRQQQAEKIAESIRTEMTAAVPISYSDGYGPAAPVAAPAPGAMPPPAAAPAPAPAKP